MDLTMRLGGPILQKYTDPAGWLAALQEAGYSAARMPVEPDADDPTLRVHEDAAAQADVVIAEVGADVKPGDHVFHMGKHVRWTTFQTTPARPPDHVLGIFGNLAGAVDWLAQDRVNVAGLYRTASPTEAQSVWDDLLAQKGGYLAAVFKWV